MVDIIEEKVELRLIDTRELVKEAKILKEAKRIADQAKKVKRQLTFSRPSELIQAGEREVLPKKQQRAQTRVGAVTSGRTQNAFTALQKKIKELEKKQKKAAKKINEFQDKIVDKLEGAKSFLTAGSLPAGALGAFGGIAARFGPLGIAVAAIVSFVVPQYFEQFDRGGIFSTKLKITEKEKNIVDIDYVIDVRSGTKFLTSDLRIVQKAPESSNTLNLQYEHVRYVSQELGR